MFNDHLDRLEKLRRFGQPDPQPWRRVWIVALIFAVAVALTYVLAEFGY